jgi:hypothetical protein
MSDTDRDRAADNSTERHKAWLRLGELLTARRAELDPRFVNRRRFAEARRVNERVVADIERGRRTNFTHEMLRALEVAYALEMGAILEAVAAGPVDSLRTQLSVTALHTDDGVLLVPGIPPNMTPEERRQVEEWARRMANDIVRLRQESQDGVTELPD